MIKSLPMLLIDIFTHPFALYQRFAFRSDPHRRLLLGTYYRDVAQLENVKALRVYRASQTQEE